MKKFLVLIEIECDDEMEYHDIRLQPDDVCDGFHISRNNRLGDITENFFMNSAVRLNHDDSFKAKIFANMTGGLLQGFSSTVPVELHTIDFDDQKDDGTDAYTREEWEKLCNTCEYGGPD